MLKKCSEISPQEREIIDNLLSELGCLEEDLKTLDHRLVFDGQESVEHEQLILTEEKQRLEKMIEVEDQFISQLDESIKKNSNIVKERKRQIQRVEDQQNEFNESKIMKEDWKQAVKNRWLGILILILLIVLTTIVGSNYSRIARNAALMMSSPLETLSKLYYD